MKGVLPRSVVCVHDLQRKTTACGTSIVGGVAHFILRGICSFSWPRCKWFSYDRVLNHSTLNLAAFPEREYEGTGKASGNRPFSHQDVGDERHA